MAAFPKFPLWTDAYLGDTTHLTTIEHGAYLLLLIAMWRSSGNEKSLPNDDKFLSRCARLGPQQWQRIKPIILQFFTVSPEKLTQRRLTDEWVAVLQHSQSQSNRARHKHLINNDSDKPRQSPGKPRLCHPIPIPSQVDYKISSFKGNGGNRLQLTTDEIEEAKKLAPGWDIYFIEAEWRKFNEGKEDKILDVGAAFKGFAKKFAQNNHL